MRVAVVALISIGAVTPAAAQTVRVDSTPAHATNSIRPSLALGAGIDRMSSVAVDADYAPASLQQSLAAGWGTVSYRLNTELHVEDWHWNPQGTWSDPAGRGYFTGDAKPGAQPIRHSWGYALPHRGYTHNEGTDNVGFSVLDDGDRRTYWKSNPYLTRPFTGEDDEKFPQWILIDLGSAQPVDAIRIAWAAPYARRFAVQYWIGPDAIKQAGQGRWQTFPSGAIKNSKGGDPLLTLAPAPISARFVRVTLTDSSGTCDDHGAADRRNCLGYAISEVYLGRRQADGQLKDLLVHAPSQSQTATDCSSVDPWHQPSDRTADEEQSGLDLFYQSGVTRGLPAMIPVSVVYGIPEDAAAEIAYLKARGYPLSYVEMGEESDGQYMTPEHYAALYLQWAKAIHAVDPALKLGGPAFSGVNEDIPAWPDARGDISWFGRFLKYLRAHGRLGDLAFMSFEHYPYNPCKAAWRDLYDEPKLITHIIDVWRMDGLPAEVPLLVTEVNLAWQSGQRYVDIFGALWLADYVGAFLTAGGTASYFFHYLPLPLGHACDGTFGTFGLHTTDAAYHIKQPVAQFFASQLITREWMAPGDGVHRIFPARSDVVDAAGDVLVTAYAALRPDGQWSLLLINKDAAAPHDVQIVFQDAAAATSSRRFVGPVDTVTFGAAQYQWHPNAKDGHADPDGPAMSGKVNAESQTRYHLPPASLTVLRGKVSRP
ncbi:MAG TPA: discoidin domain-containing protein [Polyangia bacterium]|nr:discoidin domain-containing protein [Polyangia bacterium]